MLGGLGGNSARSAKKIVPTLWVWGGSVYGQLGLGNTIPRSKPVAIDNGMAWASVSAGTSHTMAIKSTGTLWAWGVNQRQATALGGQLGLGDGVARSSPVQVGTDTDWSLVSGGGMHTMAIKTTGTLWAWGRNNYFSFGSNFGNGQLGLGNTTNRSSPVQVGTDTNWSSVSAGTYHTMAIKTTGTLWAWGRNAQGRLGLGDATSRSSPVQVGTDTNWSSVSAGILTMAIKTTGTMWAWGYNGRGALGQGNTTTRSSPVQIGTDTDWSLVSTGSLIGTNPATHTLAIKTTGTLWAWGVNTNGQLGLGDVVTRSSPVQIGTDTNWASVSAGTNTIAIKTTGSLWAWGTNANGQLGIGNSPTMGRDPVQVGTDTNWASVGGDHRNGSQHSLQIKTDGSLWSWGYNPTGPLGLGDATNRSSPVQVGTDTNWSSVSTGTYHTLAIKTTGSLWAWGTNANGQLGQGNTTTRSSPVQVGTDTNWSWVSGGRSNHTMAIKTTGSLWGWGFNTTNGQLGLGDVVNRSSPVQVGTDTNWASVSAGQFHTIAIKTTGSLWAWGQNTSGQLGQGNTTIRSSPVQMGTDTDWASVSAGAYHALAIKTTGSLWGWGLNTQGQLGLGDATNRSSPVQVGTDTNWASVSAGNAHTLAIKTSGTLWVLGGANTNGQLGIDSVNPRSSSPVQVGTDTDWAAVSVGSYHTIARKTSGSLWGWGSRGSGRSGMEIIQSTSSPVQVQTATNWKRPSNGTNHGIGVKILTTQNPTT